MIVWALFDSGNGCYSQAAKKFSDIEIYSIGLDIEKKNHHFINLNLADYSYMFGNDQLFHELDNLPKPNLIIASPPCESWSAASAMANGNACWKRENVEDSLFAPQVLPSPFTIRTSHEYQQTHNQMKYEKQFLKRVNGELTIFNTIQIIKRYKPDYYVIENPANSKIWEYVRDVLDFKIPYLNLTRYNNYGYPIQKPTKFGSNIFLNLRSELIGSDVPWNKFSRSYNDRSNIPEKLVDDIFEKVRGQFVC